VGREYSDEQTYLPTRAKMAVHMKAPYVGRALYTFWATIVVILWFS